MRTLLPSLHLAGVLSVLPGWHAQAGIAAQDLRCGFRVNPLGIDTSPPRLAWVVHVPTTDPSRVTEGGRPAARADGVKFVGTESGAAVFRVGSGRYGFVAPAEASGGSRSR